MPRRPKRRGDDGAELRRFLVEQEREIPLSGICPGFDASVAALEAGGEWRLQRWHLPFDHPARAVGGLYDELILTEADELIEAV